MPGTWVQYTLAVALGEAAGGNQVLAVFFLFGQVFQHLDGFSRPV